MATRTWFGTLTFAPEIQNAAIWEAANYAAKKSLGDFDALPEPEQFRLHTSMLQSHVARFFKRLRKHDAMFRYLMVAEPHKSGLPHFHLLLHEHTEKRVAKALLEEQWRAGFSHWRLVDDSDPKRVFYVVKYLSKSDVPTRVWNSLGYGRARDGAILDAAIRAASLPTEGDLSPCQKGKDFPLAAVKPVDTQEILQ